MPEIELSAVLSRLDRLERENESLRIFKRRAGITGITVLSSLAAILIAWELYSSAPFLTLCAVTLIVVLLALVITRNDQGPRIPSRAGIDQPLQESPTTKQAIDPLLRRDMGEAKTRRKPAVPSSAVVENGRHGRSVQERPAARRETSLGHTAKLAEESLSQAEALGTQTNAMRWLTYVAAQSRRFVQQQQKQALLAQQVVFAIYVAF